MGFSAADGDAWFQRNAPALTLARAPDDPLLRAILTHLPPQSRVTDLGGANGWRLAALHEHWPTMQGTVVDCSSAAVGAGAAAYPFLRFQQGYVDRILMPERSADLVLVSFVLHWINRSGLDSVVSLIHDLLPPNGWLALSDFWPAQAVRVPFHHRAGLWTWKRDYAAPWQAIGYRLAHAIPFPDPGNRERCGVWLLQRPHA